MSNKAQATKVAEKPTSKLSQSVTEEEYVRALQELFYMRSAHPHYRDDELLMLLHIQATREMRRVTGWQE